MLAALIYALGHISQMAAALALAATAKPTKERCQIAKAPTAIAVIEKSKEFMGVRRAAFAYRFSPKPLSSRLLLAHTQRLAHQVLGKY